MSNVVDRYLEDLKNWTEELDETLMQKPSWDLKNFSMDPLREISVTASEVIVTADLPFTRKDSVQVKPTGNSLEILARMRRKLDIHELGVSHHVGEIRKFHVYMHIPVPVDMSKMIIKYKKGILEVHMPRTHKLHRRLSKR